MVNPEHLAYWRRAISTQRQHQQQAVADAWVEVRQIAQLLRQQFGATRIIVFGSLVRDRFQDQSDLDLAVAGIAKDRYFEAVAAANGCSQRWVDLKPLEELEPYFRQRVLDTGVEIDAGD